MKKPVVRTSQTLEDHRGFGGKAPVARPAPVQLRLPFDIETSQPRKAEKP